MSKEKQVNNRGSRRSVLLGENDPRIRRDAQRRMDPKAARKAKDLEERIKKLEDNQ